ncbi:hypothetical protein OBBRIDRAFT_817732 [Obba rivulosa]|uniref:Altered inheritance of mitochondria protein 9, mitochondrial n=1 Tax=Obba rivulosa TaxID=1052685 RepID=A0A8E2DQ11_9APHY|nr:hypothetical protein OBBRIDRAFT_817732 [Obba rivulosa]
MFTSLRGSFQKMFGGLTRRFASRSKTDRSGEDDLYRVTTGRYLCNENANMAARYIPFNVVAFHSIACSAVGAQKVTSMAKIKENAYRVFSMQFDNGTEAIARFPTRLAGPPHYTTASEVAIMDFLRLRTDIPVPAVLAWSSRASETEVGAEFILMEKVPGVELEAAWNDVSNLDRIAFAKDLGKLMSQLLTIKFSHYGSLYYKNDIPEALRAPTLLESDDELASTFCIGPMVRRDFWKGERASMKIDRGPWARAEDYLLAVAQREQDWISQYATPSLSDEPTRILPGSGRQPDHINALSAYMELIPYIAPKKTAQGAWIGPAFLNADVPKMFSVGSAAPPGLNLPSDPDNLAELDEEERNEWKKLKAEILTHKAFEFEIHALHLLLSAKALWERMVLEEVVREVWSIGLIPFNMALVNIFERWYDIAPGAAYVESIKYQHGMWQNFRSSMAELQNEFGLGPQGWVPGDDRHFEEVRAAIERKRQEFIDEQGHDEESKRIMGWLWPIRDTLNDGDIPPIPPLGFVEEQNQGNNVLSHSGSLSAM